MIRYFPKCILCKFIAAVHFDLIVLHMYRWVFMNIRAYISFSQCQINLYTPFDVISSENVCSFNQILCAYIIQFYKKNVAHVASHMRKKYLYVFDLYNLTSVLLLALENRQGEGHSRIYLVCTMHIQRLKIIKMIFNY